MQKLLQQIYQVVQNNRMMFGIKKLSVLTLIGLSLISMAQYWSVTTNKDTGTEAIERWESRIMLAKNALPIERGIIGYIGEWDVPGADYGYWDQEGEYLLAQYAIAPLILKKGAVAEWNVAVLSMDSLKKWQEYNPQGFEVIPVQGNVLLIRRLPIP
jgi:hypothetical protein